MCKFIILYASIIYSKSIEGENYKRFNAKYEP